VWDSLSGDTIFGCLSGFKRSLAKVDYTKFSKCQYFSFLLVYDSGFVLDTPMSLYSCIRLFSAVPCFQDFWELSSCSVFQFAHDLGKIESCWSFSSCILFAYMYLHEQINDWLTNWLISLTAVLPVDLVHIVDNSNTTSHLQASSSEFLHSGLSQFENKISKEHQDHGPDVQKIKHYLQYYSLCLMRNSPLCVHNAKGRAFRYWKL